QHPPQATCPRQRVGRRTSAGDLGPGGALPSGTNWAFRHTMGRGGTHVSLHLISREAPFTVRGLQTKARRAFSRGTPGSEETLMVSVGLLVRLEARPGKEDEVEHFLRGGRALVQEEPSTVAWFAVRLGPLAFGIFDAFPDETGRQAHLSGRVAAALMEKASELLSAPPSIEKVDVLAAKLP